MTFARHLDLWPESLFISYQFQRVIAMTAGGGADPGESLRAAAQIEPRDWDSWYNAWSGMARFSEALAEEPGRGAISSRDALLRASNYWRAADFLLLPDDARKLPCFMKSQGMLSPGYGCPALSDRDRGNPARWLGHGWVHRSSCSARRRALAGSHLRRNL